MDYTLILPNSTTKTQDKDVIRSYFGVGNDGERIHPNGGVGSDGEDKEEVVTTTNEELLVRSANQSLLADMLVALTGSEEDVLLAPINNGNDFFDDDQGQEEEKDNGESPSSTSASASAGLILSGPTLCMTSIAESCQFTIDLSCGKVEAVCLLAISVPFHNQMNGGGGGAESEVNTTNNNAAVVKDGRLILAHSQVSVRFRPGGEGGDANNDEPTVQYAVQSITPFHTPDAPLLCAAAISLAHDQSDPFFQNEYSYDGGNANDASFNNNNNDGTTTDARDQFLLSHHLLSDSGLIAVSDHLDRLRGAAEASSSGFRSALRQLDGVTNVSAKLQFLKDTTANAAAGGGGGGGGQGAASGGGGGLGLGGFGLTLPSAEEIEAAERESLAAAAGANHGEFAHVPPHPLPPPNNGEFRFPRPENIVDDPNNAGFVRPDHRPPPPPPPMPPMQHYADSETRPRPLIGGLFMSGLSRLAAAATQPDDNEQQSSAWGGGGGGSGTGLTPPSSPPSRRPPNAAAGNNVHLQGGNWQGNEHHPTLYQREEQHQSHADVVGGDGRNNLSVQPPRPSTSGMQEEWNGDNDPRGFTGYTSLAVKQQSQHEYTDQFKDFTPTSPPTPAATGVGDEQFDQNCLAKDEPNDDDDDAGWSDDEFDFEDDPNTATRDEGDGEEEEAFNDEVDNTVAKQQDIMNAPVVICTSEGGSTSETTELEGNQHIPTIARYAPTITATTDQQHLTYKAAPGKTAKAVTTIPPPPPPSSRHQHTPNQQQRTTFDEEFVIVLKEKIDAECAEMSETGRMKRWSPLRQDVVARRRLMEVMVAQIHS
ncbi:hypothetical protein ACHAXR_008162 [Thalassiosira sp. AJA248-18]